MNLHIMPDEKIINRTIQYFEKVSSEQNKYIILLQKKQKLSKHVDLSISNKISVNSFGTKAFWKIIGDIKLYESIIIHYLSLDAARFINRIEHPNIYWIEWGGDMYNSFLRRKGFIILSDEKIIASLRAPLVPFFIQTLIIKVFTYLSFKERYISIKKIKYFVPDSMYGEYLLFLKYYPEFSHLKYREFFYYPIQEIVGKVNLDRRSSGSKIFVGNSASETNNHVEVFNILDRLSIKKEIIVPLSYGGPMYYVNYIVKEGRRIFEDRFNPILSYLSLDKYNELFYSASFFIYGSYRQEAVGNILYALYVGGKVFLHETNPLYSFYKELGLCLYSIENIDDSLLENSLSNEEYLNNKTIIESFYSNDRLLHLIETSFINE